jgi:G3E family GTPase
MNSTIPVLLLGGFLGSGKTTLLQSLLKHPGLAHSAVIVNEFGEVGIDHLLVERLDDDIALLDSGCICCSASEDLIGTLNTLAKRVEQGDIPAFDRVWIETSGLVDPSPVLLALSSRPDLDKRFEPPRLISVADAVHGRETLAQQKENATQLAMADVLVISKADLADPSWISLFEAELRSMNPTAAIFQVAKGEVTDTVLQAMVNTTSRPDILGKFAQIPAVPRAGLPTDLAGQAMHSSDIASFVLRDDRTLPLGVFLEWLTLLLANRGEDILRVKGFLKSDSSGPLLIHGVQHVVYPIERLAQWPVGITQSTQLVMITRGLTKDCVERSFGRLWELELFAANPNLAATVQH